jgi:hypothetical protein
MGPRVTTPEQFVRHLVLGERRGRATAFASDFLIMKFRQALCCAGSIPPQDKKRSEARAVNGIHTMETVMFIGVGLYSSFCYISMFSLQ